MDYLVPVTTNENDEQVVSGRRLHEFLEVREKYTQWFERMSVYGFVENTDFALVSAMTETNNPKNPWTKITDHAVKLNMAKELCMLARSDKGKQAREYFIKVEEAWNTPEMVMARALRLADRKIKVLEAKAEEDKPKVEFFNTVADSKDASDMNRVAKVLNMGIGRNTLFAMLRDKGVLMSNNLPYQDQIDAGRFRVVEHPFHKRNGEIGISFQTLVYQKGLDYIRKLCCEVFRKGSEGRDAG